MIQPLKARAAPPTSESLASWYTPGLVDGFGDRLLMFDNTDTDSLELLRFYPSLTAITGFEEALHERVRQVGRLTDHAFPLIVAVERLDGDGALALVSTHIPGKRLSAFFDRPGPPKGLNPAFVTGVVTQVTQALAMLQGKGDNIAHSAVTPERIIVTMGGRVCVVEHVLGAALRLLNLPVTQLWREFGLVTAAEHRGSALLDARTDVYQLGVLATELLIGRRLAPLELKDRLPDLLNQWNAAAARSGMSVDRLRHWLERALQFGGRGYASAADACADLRDVPAESAASAIDSLPTADPDIGVRRTLRPADLTLRQAQEHAEHNRVATRSAPVTDLTRSAPREDSTPLADLAGSVATADATQSTPSADLTRSTPREDSSRPDVQPLRPSLVHDSRRPDPAPEPKPVPVSRPQPIAPLSTAHPATRPVAPHPELAQTTWTFTRAMSFRGRPVAPWVACALAALVILEGGVIAALLMRQPDSVVASTNGPAAPSAPAASVVPAVATGTPIAETPAAGTGPPDASREIERAATSQRSGGVRLVTPIELKVLEGDRVLGSTADGPIIASAGTRQLDLINTALGLRVRQTVTFRANVISSINVQIPPGRLSVNAQPWAEVLIDDKSYGETPLANLNVPIGEHEIVFRHPEHGERRQTFVVRADQPNRVSVTFER